MTLFFTIDNNTIFARVVMINNCEQSDLLNDIIIYENINDKFLSNFICNF